MSSATGAGKSIMMEPIGIIHTPFQEATGTPVQAAYGRDFEGKIFVTESYGPALDDIEDFERLWLIYWMDRTNPFKAKVIPYRDNREHGLFATRSPSRPNPIGMSVVRLLGREGSILYIADIDILDGTQLLDIKPYIPEFDAYPASQAGWFDSTKVDRRRADGRFHAAVCSNRRTAESGLISQIGQKGRSTQKSSSLPQLHRSPKETDKNC
jgi:tRNA-Thr(GGU) m(6)t(6)A37 methyltransferase TsaA